MPKPKPKEDAAGTKKAAALRAPTVSSLQAKIARLDQTLLSLVNQRAELTLKMHEAAQATGQSDWLADPLEEILGRLAGTSTGPLPARSVRAVFRELISGTRSLVRQLRIAFLGPQYSYSHLAAIRRFGQAVEFMPVGTIAAVFEEVNRGQSDFGLVPVENSTDGRVADSLDMFTRLPVHICGDVELEIHHFLLGKCPRNEIKEVYSRPQALSQCRNWLAKHLPAARNIEVTSTSTAAQLAAEKPGAAAIASLEAGVHYGLGVLAENIEDNPGNTTRFALIGDQSAPRTGRDKCAMLFQVEHRPGTLAEAMNIFKRNRLNLTWIESFPVIGMQRSYLFFVEMEGHETDSRVQRAVQALSRRTTRLEILGSYPAAPAAV
jgi:chorismate mutase/prephenate dehydratase